MNPAAAAVSPEIPKRRFQFSLAELLVATLASSALATLYWVALNIIEDKKQVGSIIGCVLSAFFTGCVFLVFQSRVIVRTIGVSTLLLILVGLCVPIRENLFYEQMAKNEISAIQFCKSFCNAEDVYRRRFGGSSDEILSYAQSLHERCESPDVNLISKAFAAAEGEPGDAKPIKGYCFKVLKGQGAHAPGGIHTYMQNRWPDLMTLGYALVAYPATWGVTGRNSFIVNNQATVYQTDLGATTPDQIKKMAEFDPSSAWVVEE